nr:hypothetical protein CFP56_79189 [Quercus suber]
MADSAEEVFAQYATLMTPEEVGAVSRFLSNVQSASYNNKHDILSSIPCSRSYMPLAILAALLTAIPGPWPVLELQQKYTQLWKLLPEEAKSGKASSKGQHVIDDAQTLCKCAYSSLLDMFHPGSSSTAIIDPEAERSITHKDLATLVRNFALPLPVKAGQSKPVVAISLPNGPLLAITVLSVATYYTAAPIAHGSGVGAEQFKTDVLQSKTNLVLASSADVERLSLREQWLKDANIQIILVSLSDSMHIILSDLDDVPLSRTALRPTPNAADDTGSYLVRSRPHNIRR